jgi:hypothetical protein
MILATSKRPLVSIICVFNNVEVRRHCLDTSIAVSGTDQEVEMIAVDNRGGDHPSAGHSLNHGAAAARGRVLAFIQQDIYIHSLEALKRAAQALLASPQFGMLGAVGIDHRGRIVGRMRDRVVLLGSSVTAPTRVDSVDEVLFLIPQRLWSELPLAEDAELAWHAYAVEYALRLRRRGLWTGVVEIPLTHNSLSGNLAGLGEAHAALARRYPDALPVATTCGVIRRPKTWPKPASALARVVARHRWRYRWLRKSLIASRAALASAAPVVLSDIRRDVDRFIPARAALRIVNVDRQRSEFAGPAVGALLLLQRRQRFVEFQVTSPSQLATIIRQRRPGQPLLLTNLERRDLRTLALLPADEARTVGLHEGIGFWALIGNEQAGRPDAWPSTSLPAGWRAWFRIARTRSASVS